MSSREEVLRRVREALSDHPEAKLPPVPELWPGEQPTHAEMLDRFRAEFGVLKGELTPCADLDEAKTKFSALLNELDTRWVGAVDRPLVRKILEGDDTAQVDWGDPEKSAEELADLQIGLVEAEFLLADTGTAMMVGDTQHARLMCYLPPVCCIVTKSDRLRAHMQAVWEDVTERTEDPDARGEFVFISGPSRTADIEKILILGVHGPKRVVVFLIDR